MHSGFPSLPASFPSLYRPRCRDAACAFVWLLAAACPSPAVAGRSASAGSHAASPPISSPVISSQPKTNDPDLNGLSQLARLATPPALGYDIVPPDRAVQKSSGPLPGYQIVRLGRRHLNRLCLAATIGGTRGLMMVDTGAETTALSNATYHSLLLNASYTLPTGLPRAVNFNGVRTSLAEAPNFFVGPIDLGAVPVCLLPRNYLLDPGSADEKSRLYDGLLGENILRHYGAMIDCGRLVLYLNIDPDKRVDSASSFIRHGWTRVPMSDTGNAYTVPCVLNGHQFRLIVDTGAPFTNLDRNLLASAQIGSHDLPLRGGLIGTDAQPAGLVDLDRLQIGAYTATNVRMTTTPQSLAAFGGPHDRATAEPIVGLLGGDTLALNGAVIDLGHKALYLKQPGSKPARHK